MSENHAATAISRELEMVHGLALREAVLDEFNVDLPLVANHLAAREAAHGDDHVSGWGVVGELEWGELGRGEEEGRGKRVGGGRWLTNGVDVGKCRKRYA